MVLQSFPIKNILSTVTHLSHVGLECVVRYSTLVVEEVII
nr:MAG TPA: hypothetical protein [Picobirnaviridae sp.]